MLKNLSYFSVASAPLNEPVTTGPYFADFEDRAGKTHVFGASVPQGDVWKAKGMRMEFLEHAAVY